MGRTKLFNIVLYRLLEERLQAVKNSSTPKFTDMRHLFYECRNKFLKENPQLTEIDLEGDQYSGFEHAITHWCQKYCREHGLDEKRYWRVREMLNIWAKGKATCEGEVEKFLIDKDTRKKASQNCSFVLLCEKETVSRELMQRLQSEGYKLNIISTGGKSPSDVKEAVIEAVEELDIDEPTFYFLVLHDFDLAGVEIYFDLKKRYDNVIDVGVNLDFIHSWNCDLRLVEEQVKNKSFHGKLGEYIESSDNYTKEDFNYLQGKKLSEKNWLGKRIEIDAVHVEYGIEPFVKYIVDKIQKECKLWDLSRIGVEDFDLDEPDNEYDKRIDELKEKAGKAYGKKYTELTKTHDEVLRIVELTLSLPKDFSDLERKHRWGSRSFGDWQKKWALTPDNYQIDYYYHVSGIKDVDEVQLKFEKQIEKEWVNDYKDELKEINDKIKRYEGDVREGEKDLQSQLDELQEKLKKEKSEDSDLEAFDEELSRVDWGEDELKAIKVPDPKGEIKAVIKALQKRLKEFERQT